MSYDGIGRRYARHCKPEDPHQQTPTMLRTREIPGETIESRTLHEVFSNVNISPTSPSLVDHTTNFSS